MSLDPEDNPPDGLIYLAGGGPSEDEPGVANAIDALVAEGSLDSDEENPVF